MRLTHIFKGIKLFSVNSKAKKEPSKGKFAFYRKTDNMANVMNFAKKRVLNLFQARARRDWDRGEALSGF